MQNVSPKDVSNDPNFYIRQPRKVSIGETDMIKITDYSSLPEKQYIIKRLEISPGNLVLLCATGCSGKTMFVQYLATCISGNKPVFGAFDVKAGGVVHIDQEQSKIQTLRRYIRLANALGIDQIDIKRCTLSYRFDDKNIKLVEVEQELVEHCTGKSLCIIDSLKASSCADENAAEIEVVLKMFKRVAEKTQCAVLCVHHKGKGKDAKQSGRGHSSIYDSCDVQIDLEVSNEIYELSCAKNREGKYFDGIKYTLLDTGTFCPGQNSTDQLTFSLLQDDVKSTKQTQREKIIAALSTTDQLKFNDLFEIVKGDRNKFNDVLSVMLDNDELVEDKGPRNSKLYSLSENYKGAEVWQ